VLVLTQNLTYTYSYTQIASGVQTSTGSELKSQYDKCTGHQKADPSKYTEPLLSNIFA